MRIECNHSRLSMSTPGDPKGAQSPFIHVSNTSFFIISRRLLLEFRFFFQITNYVHNNDWVNNSLIEIKSLIDICYGRRCLRKLIASNQVTSLYKLGIGCILSHASTRVLTHAFQYARTYIQNLHEHTHAEYAEQDTPFLPFLQVSVSKNVLPHKKIYYLKYETSRAAKPMSILHCRSC